MMSRERSRLRGTWYGRKEPDAERMYWWEVSRLTWAEYAIEGEWFFIMPEDAPAASWMAGTISISSSSTAQNAAQTACEQ